MATAGRGRATRLWSSLGLAVAAGCVRPPLDEFCPEVAPGDLVLTEVRGPQPGSYRQWIELYNAGDEPVALGGLRVQFEELDGDAGVQLLVRDADLVVEPGAYVVLGGGDPETRPYIDYDYTSDLHQPLDDADGSYTPAQLDPRDLDSAARVVVRMCEVVVDVAVYRGLPELGTLALDGAAAPDAADNDDSARGWCVDERAGGPTTETGVRGSPGEANPPCP